MSQSAAVQTTMMFSKEASERKHRSRILIAWIVSMAFVGAFAAYGFDYYTLAWKDRPFSPKHMLLRPSGPIGVNLGMFGVLMFFLIFLYPLRKRWGWLGRQGNSRHWLDFHVVLGTAAPLVIALHSSFKFGGIAGMAFWIMTAVTLSGFIGRYLYSQIPRTLNAAELTVKEIQDAEVQLRWNAEDKHEKIGTQPHRSVRAADSRASGPHSDDGGPLLDDLAGLQTPLPGFLASLAGGRIPGVARFAFWNFSDAQSGTGTCHSNRAKAGVPFQANSIFVPDQTGF